MVKFTTFQKLSKLSKMDDALEVRGNKLFCKKCRHLIASDQRSHVSQVKFIMLL